jgi:hypothetical protein
MVQRDELLICPVIRGAGCCADVSSAHNRRRNAQPTDDAENSREPTDRMFRLLAVARLTLMRPIFREAPSCVKSISVPVMSGPHVSQAALAESYLRG